MTETGPGRVPDFDSVAEQSRIELLDRLQYFKLEPQVVIDLGSGPGLGTTELRRKFRGAQVIAIDADFACALAARRRQRFWRHCDAVCAEALALPLRAHSVDLVFSNLLLAHCPTPLQLFAQVARALRPGGLLVYSTLGPGSPEPSRGSSLASAALRAATNGYDMPRLGAAMAEAGLAEPVLDCERCRIDGVDTAVEIIYGAAFGGGRPGGAPGGGVEFSVPLAHLRKSGST
jgi:malonyl-CoA O-methyltransferase